MGPRFSALKFVLAEGVAAGQRTNWQAVRSQWLERSFGSNLADRVPRRPSAALRALDQRVTPAAYRAQHLTLHAASRHAQWLARRLALGKQPKIDRQRQAQLLRSLDELLERDLANVALGLYPKQLLFQLPYGAYLRTLPRLLLDLPKVVRRMQLGHFKDLPKSADLEGYPAYYRRNFHWQSDGYLSHHSAQLYDLGVEFLFGGTADVMRRQVIPPIVRHARTLQRPLRVLEVGSGTGRTAAQLLKALPGTEYTGLDLSPFYLDEAKRRSSSAECKFVQGNTEELPFADASFDVVFSVYLFHELPRRVRRQAISEMARVLRPLGQVIVEDSIQATDAPDLAPLLKHFSKEFHEPYYAEYLHDDLSDALLATGLNVLPVERAYLAKVVSAFKPS